MEFAVVRGKKALELTEIRDTPRQEKHKQSIRPPIHNKCAYIALELGMTWVPKTVAKMEDSEASSEPLLVRVTIRMANKGTPLFNAMISVLLGFIVYF